MSCVTSPTLTRTDVVTSNDLVTSFKDSVSTLPGSVSTSVSRGCDAPTGPSGTCIPSDVTVTVTIPGSVTTVQEPVVITVPVTSSQVTTLFGSSCADNAPTTSSTISTVLTQSTPPPLVITSQSSSTLANGAVTVQLLTTTSTLPPSAVYVSTSIPAASQSTASNPRRSANLAPIIGGVVGGFFGLVGIVALIWFILKRKRRWDDIFDNDDEVTVTPHRDRNQRFDLDGDIEPKPYQYGLVGHTPSPTLMSPPNSPPPMSTVPLGGDTAGTYSQQHGRHRSSLTPLTLSATVSNPGPSATTVSSRPSTAGSNQPLRPPSRQSNGHGHGHGPRPSSSYTHSQSGSITNPPLTLGGWNNANPHYTGGAVGIGLGIDDPHARRSTSPGMQEQQRRLTIVNASAASASDVNMHRAGPSFDGGAGQGQPSDVNTYPEDARDGKGRPMRSSSAQPVVVHTDAGAASSSAGPSAAPSAPPAYEA